MAILNHEFFDECHRRLTEDLGQCRVFDLVVDLASGIYNAAYGNYTYARLHYNLALNQYATAAIDSKSLQSDYQASPTKSANTCIASATRFAVVLAEAEFKYAIALQRIRDEQQRAIARKKG